MAWYGCQCVVDPPPCNVCTADAATLTVQISGLVDDACANCNEMDATYIVSRTGGDACLWWAYIYRSGCTGSPFFFGTWMRLALRAKVLAPSANQGWELHIDTNQGTFIDPYSGPGSNYAIYRWNSGSTADFDCTATRTLTLNTYVPDPTAANNPCDISALTITVNP